MCVVIAPWKAITAETVETVKMATKLLNPAVRRMHLTMMMMPPATRRAAYLSGLQRDVITQITQTSHSHTFLCNARHSPLALVLPLALPLMWHATRGEVFHNTSTISPTGAVNYATFILGSSAAHLPAFLPLCEHV